MAMKSTIKKWTSHVKLEPFFAFQAHARLRLSRTRSSPWTSSQNKDPRPTSERRPVEAQTKTSQNEENREGPGGQGNMVIVEQIQDTATPIFDDLWYTNMQTHDERVLFTKNSVNSHTARLASHRRDTTRNSC